MSNKYIKSPLNYVGGKHKLLPQIEPLFPKEIDTFYDLFAGGGNVGININANKVIFNDIKNTVIELMKGLSELMRVSCGPQVQFLSKAPGESTTKSDTQELHSQDVAGYTQLQEDDVPF